MRETIFIRKFLTPWHPVISRVVAIDFQHRKSDSSYAIFSMPLKVTTLEWLFKSNTQELPSIAPIQYGNLGDGNMIATSEIP